MPRDKEVHPLARHLARISRQVPPSRKMRVLGVQRELQNSPNREADDILILRAVLERLQSSGIDTLLATPEEFDTLDLTQWDLVLPMCESYPRLKRLERAQHKSESSFINRPDAVLNCYRTNMTPLLLRACAQQPPLLNFPPSEIRFVEEGIQTPPKSFEAPEGWWIKRGDVHNTCDHDVVRVRDWSDMDRVLQDFEEREITQFIVEPHIPGDLVKFYGVGPERWSTWFYHDPASARRWPFKLENLSSSAAAAANAVGLEIFGGDAIISPDGAVTIIDINSWPSFARVRPEAAARIAEHVHHRLASAHPMPVAPAK